MNLITILLNIFLICITGCRVAAAADGVAKSKAGKNPSAVKAGKAAKAKAAEERLSAYTKLVQLKEFDPAASDQKNTIDFLDATIEVLETLNVDELAAIDDDVAQMPVVSSSDGSGEKLSTSILRSLVRALKLKEQAVTTADGGPNIESMEDDRSGIQYTTYPNHPEFPDIDLSGLMKMMDGSPPTDHVFSAAKIFSLIRLVAKINRSSDKMARCADSIASKELAYESCFDGEGFPKPSYAMEHWEEDTEFARQFLSGANPVMIEVAKDPVKQLSKNMVSYFGEEKLQELADKHHLFVVSYDDLAELNVNPHQAYPLPMNDSSGPNGSQAPQNQPRYFHAPIVLLMHKEETDELDVLGIQLDRNDNAQVYTKNNCGKNLWLFVKSQVANADSQMHQWVSHLGNTHLTIEPHIIAIHNTLRKVNHPLYAFLKPLCRDTLLLNWAARQSLASFEALAFGDYQTSVGGGQFMQLIGKMWSRYSFFEKSSLPNELESRGFTDDVQIPDYHYRDDGMKLWHAIGEFAKDFVEEVYESDQAVAADMYIQDWAKETTDADKGAIPGFPTSFEDKETVTKVLQTLMWVSSGLHAAVNFGQYDFYAYVPNKPLSMRADMSTIPSDDEQIREWMFEHAFAQISSSDDWLKSSTSSGADAAIDMIRTGRLLTFPSDHCLDNLSKEFASIGTEAYATFLKRLHIISDDINTRNEEAKKANKATYNYLNPSHVPASIDI